jgi:Isoprenylcysteine carboxyl methyltransferase (ICMT) family
LGLLIVFRVFQENSYTASTVQVEANQPVISTGPYAWIRHPMYAGSVLDSWPRPSRWVRCGRFSPPYCSAVSLSSDSWMKRGICQKTLLAMRHIAGRSAIG